MSDKNAEQEQKRSDSEPALVEKVRALFTETPATGVACRSASLLFVLLLEMAERIGKLEEKQ